MSENLPNIGTKEECRRKMIEGHLALLDVLSKFVTVCEYYTDNANRGKPIDDSFLSKYNFNLNKMKRETPEDIRIEIASFTCLTLEFLDELKEALDEYENLLVKEDETATEYEKSCDYLATRDSFIDIIEVFDDALRQIREEKEIQTNENDPEFDLNAVGRF